MPLFVDAGNSLNRGVLEWLRERGPHERPLMLPEEHPDPYHEATCHPVVVESMWERTGARLPDARCVVYGTAALVQPQSGVVLAVGMGTQYCVRLLPDRLAEAAEHNCTPLHRWSGQGPVTDLRKDFGEGWVFSASDRVAGWLEEAYRAFATPPAPDAVLLTQLSPATRHVRRKRK